jgi:hypothetical protein
MAERVDAIAEVAEVAGPDPEALVILLSAMGNPPPRAGKPQNNRT